MKKKSLSKEGFTGKGTDLRMRQNRGKIYLDIRISDGETTADVGSHGEIKRGRSALLCVDAEGRLRLPPRPPSEEGEGIQEVRRKENEGISVSLHDGSRHCF